MVDTVWTAADSNGFELGSGGDENTLKWMAWNDHQQMMMCDALLPDLGVQACHNPDITDELQAAWRQGFESQDELKKFLVDLSYWQGDNGLCFM